jgi:hypothetical protein
MRKLCAHQIHKQKILRSFFSLTGKYVFLWGVEWTASEPPYPSITSNFEKQIYRIYALIMRYYIEMILIFALQPLRDFPFEAKGESLV